LGHAMERSTRSKAKSSPAQPVVSNALLEVIEETIDILHTATYPSTQVCRPLTKHNVMDIALPTKLYEEYREEGGPVRNRTNFTRPITQIIAIRDAMWKAHNSGDIEGAEIMSEKFTTYLNRFEAFMKTGVIQDD
jgi:hypothetical protein